MTQTYLNLATYNYRRAAFYAAQGDADKCQAMLNAALHHDQLAKESV